MESKDITKEDGVTPDVDPNIKTSDPTYDVLPPARHICDSPQTKLDNEAVSLVNEPKMPESGSDRISPTIENTLHPKFDVLPTKRHTNDNPQTKLDETMAMPLVNEPKIIDSGSDCIPPTVDSGSDLIPPTVDSGSDRIPPTAKPAIHREDRCLKKQGAVYSIDGPEYVHMQLREETDGILTPYLTVPLHDSNSISGHYYDTIDEGKLDRQCHEHNGTNSNDGKPVPPPRPENTLSPITKPFISDRRQRGSPPLPRSLPPSCVQRNTYYQPPHPRSPVPFFDESESKKGVSNKTSENHPQVLIKGIPGSMTAEDITDHIEADILAMENVIDVIKVNRIDEEVIVTLKNSKAAEELRERAASGETFILIDREVTVLPYQQPSIDQTKAFISGLTRDTTPEAVSKYIERRCGNRPKSVIIGKSPGTALICLDNSEDLTRLQAEYFVSQQPEERKWFISVVERSRKIRVKAVAIETTPEALKHYFENKELSQGGKTEVYRISSNDYIVTFANAEDAENVVKRAVHIVNDIKLEVSIYHPCLGLSEDFFTRKPSPKILHNLDPYMCRFLQHSQSYRRDLEDIVKSHHGIVVWPPEESKESLKIECDVDVRDRVAKDHIKDWEQNSAGVVSDICKIFSVHHKYCALEIVQELKTGIKNMKVSNADEINVFYEENLVVIAGEANHVDDFFERIKSIISSMEQTRESLGQQITKKLKLKRHEAELMQTTTCLEKLKHVYSELEGQSIIIKGKQTMVNDALSKVKETLKSFPKKNIEGISVLARKLLQMKDARKYVEKKIRKSKETGVLELLQDDTLVLYSKTDDELTAAESILKSSLKSSQIKVETTIQKLLQGKAGKQGLAELELKFKGRLCTKFHKDELHIVSLDTCHDEVKEQVMKYIDSHSYITELLPIESGVFRYIFTYKRDEIDAIEQQYKILSVDIDIIDKQMRKGFMISGEKDKCKLAIVALHVTIDTVMRSDHTITCPMFDKFLRSSNGIDEINIIELAEKCVLNVSTDESLSEISEKRRSTLASCRIGRCEIKIIEGDITEVETEYIVNPTDSAMEQKRGLGRTLVDKGGFNIQKGCKDYIQGVSSLRDGDIFVGKAGSLRCKGIIHVVLSNWKGGCNNEESILHDAVKKCLTEADDRKASSIAFPPVGFGQFCYPKEKVAEILIKEIKEYLVQNGGTKTLLSQVYVCDIEGEMSTLFLETIQEGFGQTTVLIPERLKVDQTDSPQQDTPENCFITIKKEIIIGTLVTENTDVIVNSTNASLDLRFGSLSRTLLKEGGERIASECKEKYPNGIIFGQVAETTGGNLKCKNIFHGVLKQWNEGDGHAETILKGFVRNCLNTAYKKRYTSIAFPVLGTGLLGFPAGIVADLMFDTIDSFEKDIQNSVLKTVRIVIYPEDKQSIKEFEEHKSSCNIKRRRSKTARVSCRQSCQFSSVFREGEACFTTTIGHVTLRIEHGDLTRSTTSVIVNSVGEDLNLDSGKISQALLKAGGMTIQSEANENKKTFKEEGLLMTNSGQLLCQKVIHIKAKNSVPGWKRAVSKCLEVVEKYGLNSVSFPALGTGGKGFPCEQIARAMVEALKEYVGDSYQGCLKSVAFIVYEKSMAEKFTKEVKSVLEPSPRKSFMPDFVKKVLDRKSSDETPGPRIVIHIYSESPDSDERAFKRLMNLRKNTEISVSEVVLANMPESQINILKRIGQTRGVEVCVSKDCFTLSGYVKEDVQTVETKVREAINGVRNERANGGTNGGTRL